MFKGNSAVSFKSSKTKLEVFQIVEDELEVLGNLSMSNSGGITITGSKFSGFSYNTIIEGRVSERDGRFTVYLDFQAKPSVIGWLISICAFPIGCLILILPNNAKGDMQRKSDMALSEIKEILDER
jgi:hypothetical protein